MRRPAITAAIAFLSLAAFAEPARIIFDTDMCGDYDDVGALAVLNALADAGECEILAVVSSSRSSPALGMCEMINESYRGLVECQTDEDSLPMGVCKEIGYVSPKEKGVNEVFRSMVSAIREALRYPNSDDAPDANEVYRRVLADSPDKSVTLCVVGFTTNVRRLLETKGDDISPLTGRELVAKKVKAWYQMGGVLPGGLECNLRMDAESSDKAIRNSPVPIYFVDFNLGADVLTGIPVARLGMANGPVSEAFIRCMKAWNERTLLLGRADGACGRAWVGARLRYRAWHDVGRPGDGVQHMDEGRGRSALRPRREDSEGRSPRRHRRADGSSSGLP